MGPLHFLVVVLLFVGIHAGTPEEEEDQILKDLPEIIPRERYFEIQFPKNPLPVNGNKGRLLTAAEGCGQSVGSMNRIVGGSPASNGAYPWMALLGYRHQYGNSISWNCGGSLITSRHVLTAAHCLNNLLYMVRLGEHDYRTDTDGDHQDIRVLRSSPHQQYSSRLMINDIAILHLARDADFNDRVRTVCLPINPPRVRESFVDKTPYVAGWGTTRENGQTSSVLMHVQVPVITNSVCREKYRRIGQVQVDYQFGDYVICAGHSYGGQDSCQGDSGGPLMLALSENGKRPFYQIGVVSYGIGCARPDIPGVYANVQNYADWIKNEVRK